MSHAGGVDMQEIINFFMAALVPFQTLIRVMWEKMPLIVGAFLLLLLGAFVGHWVRYGLEHLFKMVNLDEHARKLGMTRLLGRLGMGSSFATLISVVAYFSVL